MRDLADAFLANVDIYLWGKSELDQHLTFTHAHSLLHNRAHELRVAVWGLVLAELCGQDRGIARSIVEAAIFHDTRRLDDGYDTGHGLRASEYYRSYTRRAGRVVDEDIAFAVRHHDLDDRVGRSWLDDHPEAARREILFNLLKDADGLDRVRLGPGGLNPEYLRVPESRRLVDAAQLLYQASVDNGQVLEQGLLIAGKLRSFSL